MDALLFQAEALRMEKLMYHVSFTMLRNNADCADAVQEALTRAWQKRASLKSAQSFQPWLMRILVNQCNDMLRRRSKRSFFPWRRRKQPRRWLRRNPPPCARPWIS